MLCTNWMLAMMVVLTTLGLYLLSQANRWPEASAEGG